MRRTLGMLLLICACLPASGTTRMGLTLAPGDLAPPLTAPALRGWKYRANWQDNALTVVNFWGTWCAPCKTEMPALQDLFTRHGEEKLAVVGVLLDTAGDEEALKLAKDLGVSYTLVRGSSDLSNVWGGIPVVPTSFLINQRGRIVGRYVGATAEMIEAMKQDVEAFFRDRPKPPPPLYPPPKPRTGN